MLTQYWVLFSTSCGNPDQFEATCFLKNLGST